MTKFLNNADIKGYIAQTAVTSYLLKADSTGRLVAAIAGTDYQAPTTALLPSGGTAGQILAKIDGTNYNTQWIDNFAQQIKYDVKLGAALSKGTPVYVSSANGTNIIVSASSNATEATSSKTLGLLETGGALNDIVKVVSDGLLSGLDTSTATIGDPVWLGANGALIFGLANKPSAPSHLVYIGAVTRVHAVNGEIFIKVQNGFELDELHNVALTSPSTGDGLFFETSFGVGLWKNKTIASVLGYTPANGANYLPLTGGTISGDLTISSTNPRLYFTDTDNNPDYFISNTDGTFTVYDVTNSVGRFKIYSGGNAEFTGSVTTNSTFNITNGLTLFGNHISTQWYNGVDGVFVNYVGYNGGTTQFRNFYVYDGKQGVIATFDGSAKSFTLSGNLSVNNGANTAVSLNGSAFVGVEYSRASNIFGYVGTENSASGGMRYNSVNGNYEHTFYTNSVSSFKLLSTRQVQFTAYTTSTSFSGTAAGYLAFDSSGNIITVAGVAATDNTKLPLAGGTTTGIVTFGGSNNSTDNVRFQNTDGNYAYIRQTAASNSNNVWYDGTLGATMWYAWDNPGSARTAGVYTQHIFGTGRGTSNEAVTINRGAISGTNSSGTTTYSITRDGAGTLTSLRVGGSVGAVNIFNLYKSDNSTLGGQLAYDSSINQLYLWNNISTGYFSIYTNSTERFKIAADGTTTNNGYTVWHAGNLTNLNQLTNGPGYITSSATITGAAARISSRDNRTIAPNSDTASELRFGFTSWNNNSGAPYADYLHMRSYSDSSGGADNLIMFRKDAIGMRIWQQTWGSASAYSSYVDVLHSSNYNSYSPTLTGGGASGTWGINVTGSSRALLFSGDSAKAFLDGLWAGGGSYPGYQFTGGNSRFGFSSTGGVVDVYADGNFYATDSSYLVWHAGNMDAPNKSGTSYYQANTWIQFNGGYGIYFPNNYGLHFYPNDGGTYGAARINGTKNGWKGIYFDSGNTLMMNNNESGHYQDGYGWKWRWYNGSMYISTNSYGGGSEYTIWHSGNASRAGNSNLMYYAGFTLDANSMPSNSTGFTYSQNAPYTGPIAKFSEDGYPLQLNATYSGGTSIAYRTRNGDAGSWNNWYAFITSANIGSQSVNYANYSGYTSGYSTSVELSGRIWFNGSGNHNVSMYESYGIVMNCVSHPWHVQVLNGSLLVGISASGANYGTGHLYTNGFIRPSGDYGLYSQDYGGYFRRNTNSYGTWESTGYAKNGWGGYVNNNNYIVSWMLNTSGDFGFLTQNGNWWNLFYNNANNCWGIGTDNTYSGDGFRCIKYGSAQYGWTTWSDRRAKENISTITGALDKVLNMRGVYFNYIIDEAKNKRVGFIAQELQQALPEAVRYAEEIDEYNVEYGQIVSVLAEAVKEHYAKTVAQQIEIDALKTQLQTLLN
jgi:hypothetical protein